MQVSEFCDMIVMTIIIVTIMFTLSDEKDLFHKSSEQYPQLWISPRNKNTSRALAVLTSCCWYHENDIDGHHHRRHHDHQTHHWWPSSSSPPQMLGFRESVEKNVPKDKMFTMITIQRQFCQPLSWLSSTAPLLSCNYYHLPGMLRLQSRVWIRRRFWTQCW